jgi:quercetin dioxygenase-like cupin family protein
MGGLAQGLCFMRLWSDGEKLSLARISVRVDLMSVSKSEFVQTQDAETFLPEPGMKRQVLAHNDALMLVRHYFEKGWVGARHSHPHDQLVYVVSGSIRVDVDGKIFDVHAGDSFVVDGDVEHQASALEASEVLDVFTPLREDYRALVTPGAKGLS